MNEEIKYALKHLGMAFLGLLICGGAGFVMLLNLK